MATRRPVFPRPVVAVLVVVVLSLAYLGVTAAVQVEEPGLLARQAAASAPGSGEPLLADSPRRDGGSPDRSTRDGDQAAGTFAELDGMPIQLPGQEVLAVAFHEATRPEALPLNPVGVLLANENATKFTPPEDTRGPAYQILSSRGRGRPATSAVDVVVADGSIVSAPVTGEVVEVREYSLYGGMNDWRVVIRPTERPDLHLVMIHLHQPQVEVGDPVSAGLSPIAVARLLPFTSHVDYVVDGRHPHVHLEVKAAIAPAPLDPNAPAVMPEDHVDLVG